MAYFDIPENVQLRPHDGAVAEGWAAYEREISAQMSARIIPCIPEVPIPVSYEPGMLDEFKVPSHLKRLPFRKLTFNDPVTGHPLSQITFEEGWGDNEKFHASLNYNYINPWNPGPVTGESWIAVVAMSIAHPEYGNRVYVIRHDGSQARCLAVNCQFSYSPTDGNPYLHTAPIFWLDRETVFFSQSNGISLKVNIDSGDFEFVPNISRNFMCFPSPANPQTMRMAYAPLMQAGKSSSSTTGLIEHSAQCYVYEFADSRQHKLCDIYDVMKLHSDLKPGVFQPTWYFGNFQWSYDGQVLNFFSLFFYNGRVVRDLCAINYDGTGLHLVISSEDTFRFPTDGKRRKFGHLFPSGSILQNHQAILPGGRQIICCTQDPFALPPGKKPNEIDSFIDTRFLILADMDGSRIQLIQGSDLNFDGHPSSNPQGTLWLGSDYNYFIKIMEPLTARTTNIFSLETVSDKHPHETWSADGKHILFRRCGKSGQLYSAEVGFLY